MATSSPTTPTATTSNTTSTLNFPRGDNRANGVFVSLGPDGRLHAIFQGQAASRTHLIFDVTGYFVGTEEGATFISIQPRRSLDTRVGNGLSGAFQHGIALFARKQGEHVGVQTRRPPEPDLVPRQDQHRADP